MIFGSAKWEPIGVKLPPIFCDAPANGLATAFCLAWDVNFGRAIGGKSHDFSGSIRAGDNIPFFNEVVENRGEGLCWVAAFGLLCWRIGPVLWRARPDGLWGCQG